MSRLIKLDDAIETAYKLRHKPNDEEWEQWLYAFHAIPPADRPQGEWIPCSERLPKAEEKVWIQTKRGKVCFAMYEDGTISEDDSAWHWYDLPFDKWDEENDCGIIPEGWWEWTEFHPDNEFDCPVDEKVVAWMPLPKPWEGADDDISKTDIRSASD